MPRKLLFVTLLCASACAGNAPPPANQPATAPASQPAASGAAPAVQTATLEQIGVRPDWMDKTADPCQDFYRYACGKLLDETVIPADEVSWGPWNQQVKDNEAVLHDILDKAAADPGDDAGRKKIGAFYHACMDEARIDKQGLAPIKPLLDEIAKVKDVKGLYAELGALHRRALFPVFNLSDQKDIEGSDLDVAFLDQDGLGLPDRDYYFGDAQPTKSIREFYQAHVARAFQLLGEKPAAAAKAAGDVMRIETALAKMQQTRVERRDPHATYHRVDRPGLAKLAKRFPWDAYLAALGAPDLKAIAVNSTSYFSGIDDLLAKEKLDAWRHYLTWTVVNELSPYLSKPFVDESFAFLQQVYGLKELPERWKRCVRRTDEHVGELLGAEYVRVKFGPEAKAQAVAELHQIREAMQAELRALPWMDDATRAAALKKLDKMGELMGYPERPKPYDFAIGPDVLPNVLAANAWELAYRLKQVGQPIDRTRWNMTAPTVNAYYSQELNEMVFPAGMLQPPSYSKDYFEGLKNFGAIGTVMGHELTHGFDDAGSQYDLDGNLKNWWSDDTGKRFRDSAKCVIDSYSTYDALPGLKVNGALTAGEDIADIGGLKLAYRAYHAAREKQHQPPLEAGGMSEDQLYFLSYGQLWCEKDRPEFVDNLVRTDPHAPSPVRVNAGVAQVPEFGKAFSCPAGAPERPQNTCSVW